MVDEDKQTEIAEQESNTSAETMNLNDNSEVNAQVADSASSPDEIAGEENAVAAASEQGHQELAELTAQVESLKSQLEDRTSQYIRIGADFENFRKRTQKEKEEIEQKIKRDTITELLPVVDNFERARSQIKPQTDAEMTIHKSYQSVYKQMVETLKRLGVSAMRSEGSPFDPNFHEAVMREPTDEHPEGTVLEELVRGYFLGDRVLRHALVKVAAAPEPEEASNSPDLAE
ncbi:nucleotide exchange factor GrpE [Gloeocapsopsis dulcis]|uniref:Protein GrpE n=1 Tax=Gloeocapsopsis dulcis AAB1 = 1H9 TaxID=1433147 RepID=A0A6N8G0X5_9CHRO|nr:nucleotide exchange factor GrpE [Gloeocapsopsis dulcis]MUL38017.1 nucleotide exchange factor GrpE [Gloeocapsopsis dulcis AAB1 = 1H9]WNN91503.1 nucleotide exchange factor GrpE [Gloeocapsopsis dulcis]